MSDADKIIEFIVDVTDLPGDIDLNADTSLFRACLLDSIDLTELIVFIEETFNIKVRPMDIVFENFDTVNNMLSYIARRKMGDA